MLLAALSFPVGQGDFLIGSFKSSFLPCSSELSEILLANHEAINADAHCYQYRYAC